MAELPRYTWDESRKRQLYPAAAFQGVGIRAATVRKWASRGHITAVGIGPNGCRLYAYAQVIRHAERGELAETAD